MDPLIALMPSFNGQSPEWMLAAAILSACVILFFGAHWLVRGAMTVATALGIPKTVIGLTLVAFGTSAPELFVNVIAGWSGKTDIALANVSGSNLTNICVGFGVCSLAACVVVDWKAFKADCLMVVASAALILGFLFFTVSAELPFWALAPLVGLLAVYLVSLRWRKNAPEENGDNGITTTKLVLHSGLFLLGVAALYCGGEILLNGAVETADRMGMPPSLVGLTIIAAGTSIPDTIASLVAARQGEHGIAVGNLLGSNISNVLVVLSATLLASQANSSTWTSLGTGGDVYLVYDYLMVAAVSMVFLLLAARFGKITRSWGVVFLLAYFGYMGYRVYMALQLSGTIAA